MNFSFAPMEGITVYILRTTHAQFFPGVDRYFAPFLSGNPYGKFNRRERADIAPENNRGIHLVPQVLTNKALDFVRTVEFLEDLGYTEVNLNLGCPSTTVMRRQRGAAMLRDPEGLDRFFDETFTLLRDENVSISVKMRSGYSSSKKFEEVAKILNRYPISEVILHPRTALEHYSGRADREIFRRAAGQIRHQLSYNGDIFAVEDIQELQEKVPGIDSFMIGRGLLVDPALVRQMQGGPALNKEELAAYHDRLFERYSEERRQTRILLAVMKELWCYMSRKLDAGEKDRELKRSILTARTVDEYRKAVDELMEKGRLTDRPKLNFGPGVSARI